MHLQSYNPIYLSLLLPPPNGLRLSGRAFRPRSRMPQEDECSLLTGCLMLRFTDSPGQTNGATRLESLLNAINNENFESSRYLRFLGRFYLWVMESVNRHA